MMLEATFLEAGDTFTTEAGDTLTATGEPEVDPHNVSRGYRIACTTPAGDAIYWLFNADTEVTVPDADGEDSYWEFKPFIQWGPMLASGHAGWPFIACQCGETFISKDVDLVTEGASEHCKATDHKLVISPEFLGEQP